MNVYFNILYKNLRFAHLFALLLLVAVVSFTNADAAGEHAEKNAASSIHPDVALKTYRKLLKEKLKVITQALSTVLKSSFEKQRKVVGILVEKILKFFSEAKVRLTELGIAPGDPFPSDDNIKEVFSLVLENTYFLGKLVLHMPDLVHETITKFPEWKILVQYAVGFSNDSNAFIGVDDKILHLMAQEFEIVEKDPEYVNPNSRKYVEEKQRQLEMELKEMKKVIAKEKKKKQKGPKLSGPRRYEL
ncbi:hypothetical protein HELRODRAFT_167889 [Helobdella robusta]|uniref:Coiled-coil domain-containing protein 134 n=1 Tax=Helobdella robusta TaxID=6412 RepID=T1EZX4_HELRO|nr:hypothetical protein HELRODRAFT_167889 [Helobdella robusta]ESO10045.1 hypothetical protein HELRODRAFT_167889 [Helobdella robusta]